MRLVPIRAVVVRRLALLAVVASAGCRFDPHGIAVGPPGTDVRRLPADGRPFDARRPEAARPEVRPLDAPLPDAPPPDSESCVPLATPAADAACAAPPGPAPFSSVSTTRAPTIDGCPGEWSGASFYTLDRCDAGFDAALVSGGAPELQWLKVASRWDTGGVYFAIEVADAGLACAPTGTTALYEYDEIELYLDTNTARTGPYDATSHQFVVDCAGHVADYGTPVPPAYAPAGVAAKTAITPTGWFLEMKVAWAALGLAKPPLPGTQLAFDLVASDGDGTTQKEQLGVYFGGKPMGCTAACPAPTACGHYCCCGSVASASTNPSIWCENDNWGLLTLDP